MVKTVLGGGAASKKQGRRRRRDPARAAHVAARRQELLDAAVRAIRARGPDVSMEAIAAEAGITKPILYRYFGHRAGLYEAVMLRFADALIADLRAALASERPPPEILSASIDAYLAFVERDPHVYCFLTERVVGERPEAQELISGFMECIGQEVAQVVGEQLRAAGADSAPAAPLGHGLVGMVRATGDWWLRERSLPRARLVAYLTELLWPGLESMSVPAGAAPVATSGGEER